MAGKKKPETEAAETADAATEPEAATPETQKAEESQVEQVKAEAKAAVPETQAADEQPAEAAPAKDAAPADEPIAEPAEQAPVAEEAAPADEPVAEQAAPVEDAPAVEAEVAPESEAQAEPADEAAPEAPVSETAEAPATAEADPALAASTLDSEPSRQEITQPPADAPTAAPAESRPPPRGGRGGRGGGGGGRDGGRDRGRGRGGRDNRGGRGDEGGDDHIEKLVHINRVSKTVKGGKRFGFAALMVVGDGKGRVGFGHGKAREVPEAIQKATAAAKKSMVRVPLREGRTLHHDGLGHYGAGLVHVRSAPPGTGIIAGGPMRAVFESLGVADVVTKSIGTSNPYNMIRATFEALNDQSSPKSVAARRGKKIADLMARRPGASADDAAVEAEAVTE